MSNIYTCYAHIIGLDLKPNSVFKFDGYTITNSPDYIRDTFLPDAAEFSQTFGTIVFEQLARGDSFLIFNAELNDKSEIHAISQVPNILLLLLWLIKDNSVFIDMFYYFKAGGNINSATRFNYYIYTSKGNMETTSFDSDNFNLLPIYFDKITNYFTQKDKVPIKENIKNLTIQLSPKQKLYNDASKIERGFTFLWKARTESSLPVKITNYICLLECLFSSSGSELQHQVSERVALFLYKYDKELNKLETYDVVKECYKIRSTYVHGGKLANRYITLESLQEKGFVIDEICRKVFNLIIENDLKFFNDADLTNYFLGLLFDNDQ